MKKLVGLALAAAVVAWTSVSPASAEYPEKPIRIIVPFAAGGGADAVARQFAKAIESNGSLGLPMPIVNMPGAGGSIGARDVKDSPPDGYTILLMHLALLTGEASGAMDFSWQSFEPIAGTIDNCLVQAVKADSKYKSLDDLMNAAATNPDTIVYGINIGAVNHMAGIMLQNSKPGAKFRFANIGGAAPNVTALMGGTTDTAVFALGQYENTLKDQGIRALALLADERHPAVPDLPIAEELGYDASICFQYQWFAPKGTSPEIVDRLASAFGAAMKDEDIQNTIKKNLQFPSFTTGEKLRERLASDYKRIAPVAREALQK